MSDTPETDAAIKEQSEWKLPFVSTTMDGVTYDGPVASLCRRMERERDEAIHGSCVNYNFTQDARCERDEAREKAERYRLEANALMMQRDELLERNAKLRDIADRALMLNQSQ
jgi:hypothetical protein